MLSYDYILFWPRSPPPTLDAPPLVCQESTLEALIIQNIVFCFFYRRQNRAVQTLKKNKKKTELKIQNIFFFNESITPHTHLPFRWHDKAVKKKKCSCCHQGGPVRCFCRAKTRLISCSDKTNTQHGRRCGKHRQPPASPSDRPCCCHGNMRWRSTYLGFSRMGR